MAAALRDPSFRSHLSFRTVILYMVINLASGVMIKTFL